MVVAQLKSVVPLISGASINGWREINLRISLAAEMKTDMLGAFSQTLRSTFPVTVNQTNLDHAL